MSGEIAGPSQQTLRTAIGCRGIGLHSGRRVAMRLLPAAPEAGIVFRRTDIGCDIPARWDNAVDSARCTSLSDAAGTEVATIEHLMAALAGTGIDNAIVELDGPEVPIMDGSAAPFVFLIECAGVAGQPAVRRAIEVRKPIRVVARGASASLSPGRGFSMSFEIEYESPVIRQQDFSVVVDPDSFKTELSRARTFGLSEEVTHLQQAGLARGGSLDNVVVVDGDQVLNRGGLRYCDEFVRHKLLDAVGDLYLAGAPILGHFRGLRSGHMHNRLLLATLFADPEAWAYTTCPPARDRAALGELDGDRLARA